MLGSSQGLRFSGDNSEDNLGRDLRTADDVYGDGIADSIGSSQNADAANSSLTGQAHVFFGSTNIGNIPTNGGDLDGSDGATFTGAFAASFSGIDIDGIGIFHGDGSDDLLVTAPIAKWSIVNTGGGENYIIFGSTAGFSSSIDMTAFVSSQGVRINDAVANDRFRYGASNAGDVNGNGFDDIILG